MAEICVRAFGGSWLRSRLRDNRAYLQEFQDAIGDDARQAMLLRAGFATLQFSIRVLGILLVLLLIVGLAPWALQWTESQQATYFVAISVMATLWWVVRHSQVAGTQPNNTYGLLARCLHWLALEPAVVRHLSFDLECQFALPIRTSVISSASNAADPAGGAVYICGLARSGTTMLLLILEKIDNFRSLTYRDMPFVLAPNLWRKITGLAPKQVVPTERAHGDGIQIGFDSPEGFEEVFWRTFGSCKPSHQCMCVDEPTPEILESFANYRALVANSTRQQALSQGGLRRYLSKNNNNLMRLRSLSLDTTATIFLVYRNPIDTARSLHRQHKMFLSAQTTDPFTRTYMDWLAHHEFGQGHLPFNFALPAMDTTLEPSDLNYWLDYWIAVHQHILAQTEVRLHLVNHDAMRAHPAAMLTAIFEEIGISADAASLGQLIAAPAVPTSDVDFCPKRLEQALATYRELLDNNKNLLIATDSSEPI